MQHQLQVYIFHRATSATCHVGLQMTCSCMHISCYRYLLHADTRIQNSVNSLSSQRQYHRKGHCQYHCVYKNIRGKERCPRRKVKKACCLTFRAMEKNEKTNKCYQTKQPNQLYRPLPRSLVLQIQLAQTNGIQVQTRKNKTPASPVLRYLELYAPHPKKLDSSDTTSKYIQRTLKTSMNAVALADGISNCSQPAQPQIGIHLLLLANAICFITCSWWTSGWKRASARQQ